MKKKPDCLRIAHLSDPHFSHITFHPKQFLSKRWIGNLNLLLHRKKSYQTEHLWHLPELFKQLEVETAFITGDFSSTSLDEEFSDGRRFCFAFSERGIPLHVVPGNHDCYTKEAVRKSRFYAFFPPGADLRKRRVERVLLGKGWWYIGLDCAVVSPPFCSYGHFFKTTQDYLKEALLDIPANGKVIIGNHFPLFTTNRPHHDLKRAKALQEILKAFPQVKLYLHGHDHTHYIIDRQKEGYPLVLNSGSCAHKPNGTFFLLDLFENECLIQRLLFRSEKDGSCHWTIDWQRHFSLDKLK